jgi:amylosucrase
MSLRASTAPASSCSAAGFEARLSSRRARLAHLLGNLYGAAPDFQPWLQSIERVMREASLNRPPHLHQLDEQRLAAPDWLLAPEALGYSAYVERFGGDLAGVQARIPYLKALGVRYLHLLPFWKARQGDSDGGFAVSDFLTVREDVGTNDDLRALTRALSEAGIALCADLVLNHTADDHAWAKAALTGDQTAQGFYHLLNDAAEVEQWEAGLKEVFPETAPGNFTWRDELKAYVWTTFYPFQWDLNWSNPAAFKAMSAVVLDLANMGIEAFRLDSAAYLWKRKGSASKSEPQCHLILQALRLICEIVAPAIRLKAEVIAPVSEAAPFLGSAQAPECHLAYHAGLMTAGWASLAEEDADLARRVLADAPPPPEGAGWITYVRCHDDIGWMTLKPQIDQSPDRAPGRLERIADHFIQGYGQGEKFQAGSGPAVHGLNGMAASLVGLTDEAQGTEAELALSRLLLLNGLALAAGGMPLIYMGDELAQTNDETWREDSLRAHEGRWLHRPEFDEASARAPEGHARLVRTGLEALLKARQRLPALTPHTAPQVLDVGSDPVLAFTRSDTTLCLFNFSAQPRQVRLPHDKWRNLLNDETVQADLFLSAYGMAWLMKERP